MFLQVFSQPESLLQKISAKLTAMSSSAELTGQGTPNLEAWVPCSWENSPLELEHPREEQRGSSCCRHTAEMSGPHTKPDISLLQKKPGKPQTFVI